MRSYRPPQKILKRYADVLVNFALGEGKGVKKGDVVYFAAYEYAKPLYVEILRALTKAGANTITHYIPNSDKEFNPTRDFYVNAREHQINFFPSKYFRGLVDEMDHSLFILSETDMEALKGVPPEKIMARSRAFKPYQEWRREKENRGKFSWTLALYGTAAQAREAGLSEREYWGQIIKACYLDRPEPVAIWKKTDKEIRSVAKRLTHFSIKRLHVEGPDADLWVTLGEKRKWAGGGGANIPSFEIFTSPDARGTEGWIRFNQPTYRQGNIIEGTKLVFRNGAIVEATARRGEKFLRELVKAPGANRIGEYSLTDRRFSRITKFMAETLYDENIGGPHGNTHLAIGSSYHMCYDGDPAKIKKAGWKKLGFNDSPVHQDFISTVPRTVTAYLSNSRTRVIYRNGEFVL